MEKLKLEINGDDFQTIEGFYDEINRLLMQDEDWKLGVSLDAFDDLLYGGYGSLKGFDQLEIVWKNSAKSSLDLGLEATLNFYEEKLKNPDKFNQDFVQLKIADLKSGIGKTYFEILIEIISAHSAIQLVLK